MKLEQKAADGERTVGATVPPDTQDALDQLLSQAPQTRAALTGWRDMTLRDFARAIRSSTDSIRAATIGMSKV